MNNEHMRVILSLRQRSKLIISNDAPLTAIESWPQDQNECWSAQKQTYCGFDEAKRWHGTYYVSNAQKYIMQNHKIKLDGSVANALCCGGCRANLLIFVIDNILELNLPK